MNEAPGLPLKVASLPFCSLPSPVVAWELACVSPVPASELLARLSWVSPEQGKQSRSSPHQSVLTSALRVEALPALSPGPSALGATMGCCCALPAPLLGAIGAGHWALAPWAPLLPLSVDCHSRQKRDGYSRVTTQPRNGLAASF